MIAKCWKLSPAGTKPTTNQKDTAMTSSARVLLDAILRNDFLAFVQRCFMTLNPGAAFSWNWHIEAIAYHLELVRMGKIRRLIVNVPPRSLKSTICSVAFPAFVLGRDPRKRLIAVSYGADLANMLGNDCRAVMQSAWYQRLFPGTRISRVKNTENELRTTQHGYRLATSVGGTLTGRGGEFAIIDDPLKPQDAYSDSKREAANDWFGNTLLSRLDDKRTGAIVVVMQRLHLDDLAGRLSRSFDDWTVLNLPAIAEHDEQIPIGEGRYHFRKEGDLLHPEREPMSVLNSIRAQLGSDVFAAQYQQNPVPSGGNMVKRHWVRRYDDVPNRTPPTHVLQSWDTASKEGGQNDWSVCTTWYVVDGKFYLVDVLRGRFDYPTLKARAIAHAQLHRPTKILIEDTGVGTALVPEIRDLGFTAVAVPVEHNKQTRMSIQSGKFESGQVFFPNRAPWLEDLETELFAFPGSRHDDQVDSISQALGDEIRRSVWDAKSVEGLGKFVEAVAMDRYLGMVTGRPW
jgi:predicted phage terminase large subunit-like protein